MEDVRNPFILGHRISRPYFCDREEEERRLVNAVTNGRNVVLISPRRMGKTSLVHIALNDSEYIRQNYLTFFFDILQTNTLGEFTYLLGKSIFDTLRSKSINRLQDFLSSLKSLKGRFGFDPISGTPTFDVQLGDIKHPEYTLGEIFKYVERSEKPVLIMIDEFQQITKYPEKNTEAILRSHIQMLGNATFVFAGSERTILQQMFVSSKRPFYNSSEIMYLKPIKEEIYVEFARHLFAIRGKDIESEPIKWVFNLFEGNTFYMQWTMNGAFANTPVGAVCNMDSVRQSVREILTSNEVMYREMLSNVSVSLKLVLFAIAKEGYVQQPLSGSFIHRNALPSSSSVQSALRRLSKSGLIAKTEEGYSLTDPLLRIFINEQYSTPLI